MHPRPAPKRGGVINLERGVYSFRGRTAPDFQRAEGGVQERVVPHAAYEVVLVEVTFVLHADLLEHAPRARVLRHAHRPEAMEAETREAHGHHGARRFGRETLAPCVA